MLRHNNAELLSVTPVATLRERVFQVFGSRILDDLLDLGDRHRQLNMPLEAEAPPGEHPLTRSFRLRGFISGPQVQKLNRNSIYLFVNGRLIRDRLLLHAISAAYHNLMPAACYPFALLFLDCDAEEVDVNVHPSKTGSALSPWLDCSRFRARYRARNPDGAEAGIKYSCTNACTARR